LSAVCLATPAYTSSVVIPKKKKKKKKKRGREGGEGRELAAPQPAPHSSRALRPSFRREGKKEKEKKGEGGEEGS